MPREKQKGRRHSTSFDEDSFALLKEWEAELNIYEHRPLLKKIDQLAFDGKHLREKLRSQFD